MSIGVLLGGCGYYDGTDVHEAVFTLLAIETAKERAILVAPDVPQGRTVDHTCGDESLEDRNVLRESARLARLPVRALSDVRPSELEALIIPGGYGPVVNLSTGFAKVGEPRAVRADVTAFLLHFLDTGKPIGCVSLGEIPVRTVLGQEIEVPAPPASPGVLAIDQKRAIFHTPGFTLFTRLADVKAGIDTLVAEVLKRVVERRRAAATAARGATETR